MSSSFRRGDLRGIILQGDRVVGGLDLPDPCESFIQHFNDEYSRIGLRVAPTDKTRHPPDDDRQPRDVQEVATAGV
jgi:hypothetical protein